MVAIFAERITRVVLTRLGMQGRIQLSMVNAIHLLLYTLHTTANPIVVTRPIARAKNAHLGPPHPVNVVDDGCAECVLQTA